MWGLNLKTSHVVRKESQCSSLGEGLGAVGGLQVQTSVVWVFAFDTNLWFQVFEILKSKSPCFWLFPKLIILVMMKKLQFSGWFFHCPPLFFLLERMLLYIRTMNLWFWWKDCGFLADSFIASFLSAGECWLYIRTVNWFSDVLSPVVMRWHNRPDKCWGLGPFLISAEHWFKPLLAGYGILNQSRVYA